MAYTLNSISLGDVQEEPYELTSSLDTETYPMSGSKDIQAIDEGNVVREITLKGTLTADTQAALMDIVAQLDALQNGDQQAVIYHSDMWDLTTSGDYTSGNFSVKVKRFTPDLKVPQGNCSVTYTLVMVESV